MLLDWLLAFYSKYFLIINIEVGWEKLVAHTFSIKKRRNESFEFSKSCSIYGIFIKYKNIFLILNIQCLLKQINKKISHGIVAGKELITCSFGLEVSFN